MEFSRELLFFFSALGVFNGVLLGLYFLLIAKPRHISSKFLGLLLLALSFRIGKSVFFYFNPELAEIYLQLGVSACAFVGPSLYFYLKTKTGPEGQPIRWIYHYLIILIAISTIGILYPWEHHYLVWRYTFKAIYFEWLIYIVASGVLIKETLRKVFSRGQKMTQIEIWISSIFIGNALVWVAFNIVNYTSYIVGALSFSFILYLVILFLIFNRKKESSVLRQQIKYADKKIDQQTADSLVRQINVLMQNEALYKNPNLKMADLAKRLNVLPHVISQLANDNLGKNFAQLINEFRIEEAKRLIISKPHLKFDAIGEDCGFNSKSTFYSTFKKLVGTTPAQFLEMTNQQSA